MPMATKISGLMARVAFLAYAGCCGFAEAGSASSASWPCRAASISGVRRTTHTGLPRHSTVFTPPGGMSDTSTSTGPPAARARSLGANDETNGMAVATAATPPMAAVLMSQKRRSGSSAAGVQAAQPGGVKVCSTSTS